MDERQKFLEALREDSRNEARAAKLLVQHAERGYYPQFRE
jgi:hypothetical protein